MTCIVGLVESGTVFIGGDSFGGSDHRRHIRNGVLVRLEKRRNPDKGQKARGIIEPWYIDAAEDDPADRFIWDAARNADLGRVPDGEWSGESIGPKIQGNPLGLDAHTVILFSLGLAPTFEDVPIGFEELRDWFAGKPQSKVGTGPIEGIVWHDYDGPIGKIKAKDFR